MSPTIAATLPERLRRHNAEAHGRLETTVDIMRPGLSLGDYTMLLVKFHGFISGWEAAVRRASAGMPALETLFADRFKCAWLEDDLTRLDFWKTSGRSPVAPALPDLSTLPRLLGSAYVMEGSTLGARFVAAHVQQCLGGEGRVPCRYFTGYGARTGSMWNAFLATMCDLIPESGHREALEASGQTFECLERWFSMETENSRGAPVHA